MNNSGYFKSQDNELFYSCVIPKECKKNTGILFVHAANGNRFGPHRMYVEFSNKFNLMGYPTFRFDMRGCGDSRGIYNESEIDCDIMDTLAAIKFFMVQAELKDIILLGISKGARVCYSLMSKHEIPMIGAILLSTSLISPKSKIKYLKALLRCYYHKLNLRTIMRVLKGQVDFRQIYRTFVFPHDVTKKQKTHKQKKITTKSPVLLIYGSKDPIFEDSKNHYVSELTKHQIPCYCHVVKNANHSFYNYIWKEEIFNVTRDWLLNL